MSATSRDVPLQWVDAPDRPTQPRARTPIALALLCTAIFACSFAIGRATVSTSAPHPTAAPNLPITYAGAPIPARLGDAPPLGAIRAPRTATRSHRHARPSTTTRPVAAAVARPLASSSPTTVSAPPPAVTKAPTPAASTPARRSQPHKSGGVSFDSSG